MSVRSLARLPSRTEPARSQLTLLVHGGHGSLSRGTKTSPASRPCSWVHTGGGLGTRFIPDGHTPHLTLRTASSGGNPSRAGRRVAPGPHPLLPRTSLPGTAGIPEPGRWVRLRFQGTSAPCSRGLRFRKAEKSLPPSPLQKSKVPQKQEARHGAAERQQDRKEHLRDLLGQAVRTALEDLDDLLVMRRVLCKANLQLPEKLATLLKGLLLLKLPQRREGKSVTCAASAHRTRHAQVLRAWGWSPDPGVPAPWAARATNPRRLRHEGQIPDSRLPQGL